MKYFVVSDIHNYFEPMIEALNEKGFDISDPSHKVIICGDLFDRGPDAINCLRFVNDLIKENKVILVKGNHDVLLEECCMRGYPQSHDKHNGTVQTILDLGSYVVSKDFAEACDKTIKCLKTYRKHLVNYYETKNHIFVHGWIPCAWLTQSTYYGVIERFDYKSDWRDASELEWTDSAMWQNGMKRWSEGIKEPNKTIVCGHFHTSWGHSKLRKVCDEFDDTAIFEPFIDDGIIAIDGCVHYTGKVNCVVIEDEELDN